MWLSTVHSWLKRARKSTLRGCPEARPGRRPKRTCRPCLEVLEDRTVPTTTFTVKNLNDAGDGSLRFAVLAANDEQGLDTITFAPGLAGTITLTTGQLEVKDSVTILGPGAGVLTVSGNNASRIFRVENLARDINVAISGLTLTRGTGDGNGDRGGAIFVVGENLTLSGMVVTGNHAFEPGGGLAVGRGGTLTMENCTVRDNRSEGNGGGVGVDSGTLVVRNTTISGNTAQRGGGIFAVNSALALANCTISGNTARQSGGGIKISTQTTATIRNSTVAFNTADSDNVAGGSGGGLIVAGGSATLQSTIVANNALGSSGSSPDVDGTVTAANSLIENIIGTTFTPASANNLFGQDPLLGPLANNGGPTQTHALLAGSPARDAGSNTGSLPFDQRGFARVRGAAPDIGAFEADPPPPTPVRIVAVPFRQRGVARVRVRDAATGAVRGVLTPFKGFRGRLRLQLLDVNGDGSLDLVVKALIHGKRKKKVYDAVTLAPLPPGLA
jgi:parallel beta-helix repeat protein